MFLINAFIHLLTGMFLIGLVGSAVVVTMAFVQDFGVLFGKDDEPAGLGPNAGLAAQPGSALPSQQRSVPGPVDSMHAIPRH